MNRRTLEMRDGLYVLIFDHQEIGTIQTESLAREWVTRGLPSVPTPTPVTVPVTQPRTPNPRVIQSKDGRLPVGELGKPVEPIKDTPEDLRRKTYLDRLRDAKPNYAPTPRPQPFPESYGYAVSEWIGYCWSGNDYALPLSADDEYDLAALSPGRHR